MINRGERVGTGEAQIFDFPVVKGRRGSSEVGQGTNL